MSEGKAKDSNAKNIRFRFCDSMGIEGDRAGMRAADFGKIMDGYVTDTAEVSIIFFALSKAQ